VIAYRMMGEYLELRKMKEEGYGKLHSEKVRDLNTSQNINSVIKSRRMGSAEQIGRKMSRRMFTKF